jgi:RimK family alpha-L-glutamate ligase
MGVDINKGKISFTQTTDNKGPKKIDVDGAFLRHLGMFRDYEQFSSRLWSVKAIEQSGVPVINEISSWLLASDKLASFTIMAKAGIKVPHTFVSEDMFSAYAAAKPMDEVVVKRLTGSMGYGVFRVKGADFAMHVFSYFNSMSKPIYLQEYLEKKGGGDYRVVVVGGKVLGAEFRKGKDWKSNIAQGGKPMAAKVDSEMKEIALKATKALCLDYAGIDIADTKEGYMVLDTNPTMSWQGFVQVNKVDVAKELIAHLIKKIKN